jgi:hypothetical protein
VKLDRIFSKYTNPLAQKYCVSKLFLKNKFSFEKFIICTIKKNKYQTNGVVKLDRIFSKYTTSLAQKILRIKTFSQK